MSIATAERLKKELTDKYVVVAQGVPELKRFAGLTGTVKTVNMNGRALVEFDGPADIGWYDISPDFLTVVDAPVKKEKPAAEKAEKPAAAGGAKKKSTGGMSPLEAARAQGAAGKGAAAGGDKPLSPLEMARQQGAAKAAAGGSDKPLSPLELARQQGAAGAEKPAEKAPAAEEKPKAAADDASLSPLERARLQDGKKKK